MPFSFLITILTRLLTSTSTSTSSYRWVATDDIFRDWSWSLPRFIVCVRWFTSWTSWVRALIFAGTSVIDDFSMRFIDSILNIIVWVEVKEIVGSCSNDDNNWNKKKDVEGGEYFFIGLRLCLRDIDLWEGGLDILFWLRGD